MKLHKSNLYNKSKLLAFTGNSSGRMLYIIVELDSTYCSILDPFNYFPEQKFTSLVDATMFVKDILDDN